MPRKRKKRRPAKRNSSLKRILAYGGLTLFVLFVVGGFAIYLGLRAYLHSDAFRQMLGEQVSDTFEADGQFSDFKWSGTTAYTESFTAHGYPGALFSRVRAESIEARVNFDAVWRRVWEIGNIDIDRMNILIDSEDRAAAPVELPSDEDDDSETEPDSGGGFLSSFYPNRVAIKRLGIAELNFDLDAAGQKVFGRRSVVEIKPTGHSDAYRIGVRGGNITIVGQPQLELREAEIRAGNGAAIIDHATFRFHEVASLNVDGSVGLDGDAPDLDLELRVRDLPADKALPEDWAKKLKGTIEADAFVKGTPGQGGGVVFEGDAKLRKGVLEAMPILDRIDAMLGSSRFRRLAFSDFRVKFRRAGSTTELLDYYALSAGSACLKGHADLPDEGRPSGKYMIGVTTDTIKWLPLIKKAVIEQVFRFSRDDAFSAVYGDDSSIAKPPEGFRWAVATIVSDAPDPYTADIREQFIRAGGLALWGELLGAPEKAIEAMGLLANAAKDKGVDVMAILVDGQEREGGMFGTENLMRAATELGVGDGMTKLLEGVIDNATGIPGTIFETGSDLLNGINPFAPRRGNGGN